MPFASVPVASSLPLTESATLPSAGGFLTLTVNSTGWVTQALSAPLRLTTGGAGAGAHFGSAVSLPRSSIQKLLQILGVTSRYRTQFEENSNAKASIGLGPAHRTSMSACGCLFFRDAMKGRRVPVGTWIDEMSAVAAARSRSSRLPFQPTSSRIAATSAFIVSLRRSTRRSSAFVSGFAKRVAGLPSRVALCCCASAVAARTPRARAGARMAANLVLIMSVVLQVSRSCGSAPLVRS